MSVPKLILEYTDKSEVGIDEMTGEIPEFLLQYLKIIMGTVPEPERVNLIISGDFLSSVRSRISNPQVAESYTLGRGSGVVGGKTMPRENGEFDILLHAWLIKKSVPTEDPDTALLSLRTLIHETFHVAMYQRGETLEKDRPPSYKEHTLLASADSVIDEFRAERASVELLQETETDWSLDEVARELDASLLEIVWSYQDHRDVGRLVDEVGTACLISWKSLAFASAFLAGQEHGVTPTMVQPVSKAWSEMCGHTWEDFQNILVGIPSAASPLDSESLQLKAVQLSNCFDKWLQRVGFEWEEPSFRITQTYLLKLHRSVLET